MLLPPAEPEDVALISTPADLPRTTPSLPSARLGLSVTSIAVLAASALIYISGSFLIAEALGIKRPLQAVLAVPVVFIASYYLAVRPRQLLDPLIGFVVLKTAAEIAFRGTALDLFDNMATLLGLAVIRGASAHATAQGVRLVITLAGVLAVMATAQWIALFFDPGLLDELLGVDDEGKVVGDVHHVIALLGLASGEQYSLFGHEVTRLQSFSKEPSLNLVYFLIPSAMAFLRGGTAGRLAGIVTLSFSLLSLSGSVFLSLAFSAVAWLGLRIFSVKTVFAWGTLLTLGAYLAAVQSGSLGSVVDFITLLSTFGNFLGKTRSFTVRAGGTASSLGAVAGAPLGSAVLPDNPAPWMVNGSLAAGWLGAIMLVLFVRQLAIQLDLFNAHRGNQLSVRIGVLLLIGAMATVIVFNDYQMSNYAGLVLLALVYRMIESQNELDGERRRALGARPAS